MRLAPSAAINMMGFHLLRRAGYPDEFRAEVARVMEYSKAYQVYREDIEIMDKALATAATSPSPSARR